MTITSVRQWIVLTIALFLAPAYGHAAPDQTQIRKYQEQYKLVTGQDIPSSIVNLVARQPNVAAQINELPYFGFQSTDPAMMDADRKFIDAVKTMRETAVTRGLQLAWAAFYKQDFTEAARHFNQVFLIDPNQSQIAHGHAILMFERFGKDSSNKAQVMSYVDDLFRIAMAGKNPAPPMMKDYALIKIRTGQYPDAVAILEKEVAKFPDNQELISDLAVANIFNRNIKQGCEIGAKADPKHRYVAQNLLPLLQRAGCPRAA